MIKKYDEFNEGLGKLFKSDRTSKHINDGTALDILNKISDNTHITPIDTYSSPTIVYEFEIDDSTMRIAETTHLYGNEYHFFVDDIKMDCNKSISKKIFDKINSIYFDKTNEGLGHTVRKWFNDDEDTALGIYNKITDDLYVKSPNEDSLDTILLSLYEFNIDDFEVRITKTWNLRGHEYHLYVDDAKIDCSSTISKRIFNKIESIYTREERERQLEIEENDDYIRKDAKIHFGRK